MQQDTKPIDLFRDGCKTIMSVLVILTNDCGRLNDQANERVFLYGDF